MTTKAAALMIAAVSAAVLLPASAPAQEPRESPIFTFESDEFWLNLHHFLYVLGRAHASAPDASRDTVAAAPTDAERGLQEAGDTDRKVWNDAVAAYANDFSRRSPIFDPPLAALTLALTAADDSPTLADAGVDPAARIVLERAAPIYRQVWWSAHRTTNRAFQSSTQTLVARHGRAALDFVVRAYGLEWPAAGYLVHLVVFAHALGNYSTTGNLLVMSTNPNPSNQGLLPLEIALHEGMHQWDDAIMQTLRIHAMKLDKEVPPNLTHALIWMTAGEAVRRLADGYVPYAEAFGIWARGMAPLAPALQRHWKPYLEGSGTRDEALGAVLAQAPVQ